MDDLATAANELRWYHTIELPGGVVTRGFYDTRRAVGRVPLPESLADMRCLDIASSDGFWAFEMERRGASEVLAIDLAHPRDADWPGAGPPPPERIGDAGRAREAFEFARRALGSSVERVELSVYDLSPEAVGEFDFVFIGNVLVHLRDPIGALQAAHTVTRGELFSVDVISPLATLKSPRTPAAVLSGRWDEAWWWLPNRAAYYGYFVRAGFELVAWGRPFRFPFGEGFHRRPPVRELLRSPSRAGFWLFVRPGGPLSAWVQVRPA